MALEAATAFWPAELDSVSRNELRQKIENEAAMTVTTKVETEAEGVCVCFFFIDEEVVFGMPRLLRNMAEEMLLPPPHCYGGHDMETNSDMSLWNYSICFLLVIYYRLIVLSLI